MDLSQAVLSVRRKFSEIFVFSTVDVWFMVTNCSLCRSGPESQKMIRSLPVLVDYARRIHVRYFNDYEGLMI